MSSNIDTPLYSRTQRLVGPQGLELLRGARVIVFGVGGVGSWAAEALARTAVGHITLVDADCVSPTNINRQAEATVTTVGEVKVQAMAARLRQVAPEADIRAIEARYTASTASLYDLEGYDVVIDAIDALSDKASLLLQASWARSPLLLSSMGAALKSDPEAVRVAEFWKVQGCPLAAALRRKFREEGTFPRRKFKCVYSPQVMPNLGAASDFDPSMNFGKAAYNGSLCHITAIFGFTLAGLAINHLLARVTTCG